ncbi:aromatic ring-hydroxylating oxygenase subunit alpha [Mycolicibacterium holsaticum]|uniref:aromatic ring-hydroxylating oxygenase subunit alpha n=2 Tax=Mycolicibacterium holsaticum TaxID=152142 RepID=UPI001C7D8AB5|nr:Rieske 2Fe-2S domain-containing protein [Mycolicibacterium holsaticum]MDA4109389.1 3-phenylpropionate dioxygenase [Mycolicibacterium holsaticum DSM 44478 = JCM 12374]QZA11767.1 Rieske 2Fe-2S domain-containing protein [Mycolicibacterium holsaticum DSM 44478 = JCM 12374]UNC10745.1 Rieske 2Fe-2S domain-containing protein [Mycolicibacterium holsaticum DSM 44478 = JCM 12374]
MIDMAKLIDPAAGTVAAGIFADEQIYQRELEQVWPRVWVFLAHDCMLPKPGSYLQNYIGEDPILVVRQKDGSVKAFLNQCRHRGMRICRADAGTAKAFMCSFHGWTYGTDGQLINVPHEDSAYGPGFDRSRFGAVMVPRLRNYKGFWFGCWDKDAPDLVEYLGDAAWYLDGYVDRWEGGVEAVAVHKWVLSANWKFNVEQPTSDMQHAEITHVSAVYAMANGEVVVPTGPEGVLELKGRQYFTPFGHGGAWLDTDESTPGFETPELIAWEKANKDAIVERRGSFRSIRPAGHSNIFPNFMYLGNGTMRVTHPRGPGEMEIWAWTFVPKAAPSEVKEAMRIDVMRTFSPGGMFEQDDAENWHEMQHILRGSKARAQRFSYPMRNVAPAVDQDGYPGATTAHPFSDNAALNMYDFYADLMSGMNWDDIKAKRAVSPDKTSCVQGRPADEVRNQGTA